ncbi:MAG: D-alanyl-D-alanine carboxypeptidase [Defluviitaleaceae bacterium]|nr:D-alanyl-D-alanine carboxypeptidase [Defluviitaleaceae bacterium]
MKILFLLIVLFSGIPVFAEELDDAPQLYYAGSVLVMDADTGFVLYETEGFARRYPASITKIMTALLVLEHVEDLSERMVFSENAVYLPYYAGRMGMEAGESMSVLEALYGIMLVSANEIARGLAEFVSGDISEFVELMNRRAHELGAYNTRFINPCGLPGTGQHVTAYDIALIMREAVRHPIFTEIISTPYFYLPVTPNDGEEDVQPAEAEEPRLMRNTNVMVRPTRDEFNEYVTGGKTGFTNAARHTLVTYANLNGREVIISVLYAQPRGIIFSDTNALINHMLEIFENPVQEILPVPAEHGVSAEPGVPAELDAPAGHEAPAEFRENSEITPVFAYYNGTLPPPENRLYELNPEILLTRQGVSTGEAIAAAAGSITFLILAFFSIVWVKRAIGS